MPNTLAKLVKKAKGGGGTSSSSSSNPSSSAASPKLPFRFLVSEAGAQTLPVEIDILARACAPDDGPKHPHIKTVLIAIHGRDRNAQEAYEAAEEAVRQCGDHVLAVAPQFYNGLDKDIIAKAKKSKRDLLIFKGNDWGHGAPAVGSAISSFEVLDRLVESYQAWPSVEHIVVVGHSLGAQLVHRWCILSQLKRTTRFTFLVMNPSTFLFFDPNASYKYGFKGLGENGMLGDYFYGTNGLSLPILDDVVGYFSRTELHILNGDRDDGVGDDRPAAMAQGRNRHERSRNYQAHVSKMPNVTFDVVAGASHSFKAMLCSPIGLQCASLAIRLPPS